MQRIKYYLSEPNRNCIPQMILYQQNCQGELVPIVPKGVEYSFIPYIRFGHPDW